MYEGSLCLCCMSTESLVQLFVPGAKNEDYVKMLALCLCIPLSESDGHDYICTVCIDKLKNCICFKKEALKSISILLSLELSDLLSTEDLQVLGLAEEQKNTQLEHVSDVEVLGDSVEETIANKETKKKVKRLNIDSRICYSRENDNDSQKVQDAMLESPGRGKRAVGRPRLHSPALPYRLRPDELACRECQLLFPNHITLKVHYNTHFGRHACSHPDCSKRFQTRASLRKHAAAHLPGPFRCDKCDQEFTKLNTLLSHKRLKHGAAWPFRCARCGARFRTATRRRRHLAAAHAQTDRRYVCQYCDNKFLDSGSLSKHVSRVHLAEYVRCGGRGGRGGRGQRHVRAHPGLAPRAPSSKERRFSCLLCGAAFAQKHSLQYHCGAHVRRGDYSGDPATLVGDTARHGNNYGLLQDVEETPDEQHLDERALSDDPPTSDVSCDGSGHDRTTSDAGDNVRLEDDDDACDNGGQNHDVSDDITQNHDASYDDAQNHDASDDDGQNHDASDHDGQNHDANDDDGQNHDASDHDGQNHDASDHDGQNHDASDNDGQNHDASDDDARIHDASDHDAEILDMETLDNQHDIYTYLDFNIPNDFDD